METGSLLLAGCGWSWSHYACQILPIYPLYLSHVVVIEAKQYDLRDALWILMVLEKQFGSEMFSGFRKWDFIMSSVYVRLRLMPFLGRMWRARDGQRLPLQLNLERTGWSCTLTSNDMVGQKASCSFRNSSKIWISDEVFRAFRWPVLE